jgi:hypothetical protein
MNYSSLIDTVMLRFQLDHKPFGPRKQQEVDGMDVQSRNSIKIYGRYGNTLEVRSADSGKAIEIRGSINKFGNGHNLAGSEDLSRLSSFAFRAAFAHPKIAIPVTRAIQWRLGGGDVTVLRLDLTAHADLGNLEHVRCAQKALKMWLPYQPQDFRNFKEETLYIGWNSNSRRFKTYIKELEMVKHPPKGPHRELAMSKSAGLLRLELALHSKWLGKTKLGSVSQWTPELCHQTMHDYLEQMNWGMVNLAKPARERDSSVDGLICRLHELGDSIELLGDDRWYGEHRRSIKRSRSVDIAIPMDVSRRVRATYDLGELTRRIGFGQPQWALETGLVAMPVTQADWEGPLERLCLA